MITKLHIRTDIGTGSPMVLLHGIFADGTQWETITELLKNDFRVIVVDLLGHGKSPRSSNLKYTPDEHADALRAALESINATENLTVVGYSMGGDVALSYAAKYQESINQLYLISAPFYLNPDQMISSRYAAGVAFTKLSQWFYKTTRTLLGPNKILNKLVGYADRSDIFHKMIGANDNKLDPKVIDLNLKNMISEFDFASRLEKLNIPVTYYAGKKDPFIVQGQLQALKQFCPHMDINRLDIIKIDHMLVQNLPKEIVHLITANKNPLLNVGIQQGIGDDLVLIHGIESSSSYWANLVPSLSKHQRVTAIDLLGFGKSPKPKNIAYSLDDQVKYLNATLESLGIDNFSFGAHSLGSLVALAYAAKYPKKVTRLTLFSPVLLPEGSNANRLSVKFLQKIKLLPDTNYLYNQLSRALGDNKLRKFVPTIRSVKNAVQKQNSISLSIQSQDIPISFNYGTLDPLIEPEYINQVAKIFKKSTVNELKGKTHNFPLLTPEIALSALLPNIKHTLKPKITSIVPPNVFKQLYKLAVPVLAGKSLLYICIGLLLFSNYAAATLVIGLSFYIILQGYRTIKGSFSLKNEGLSYVGYVFLGLLVILIGFSIIKHPETSLRISVYFISILVAAAGFLRILVSVKWTKSPTLKKSLLMSGVPMLALGLAATMGGMYSIYIIIYTIAILLIIRGFVYGWYVLVLIVMSYIRGFNSW